MFKLRNDSNVLRFDLSEPIFKFLGEADIGATATPTSGTITDSRFELAEPHAFVIADTTFTHGIDPDVTISGTTLTWSYPAGVTPFPVKIIYGIL